MYKKSGLAFALLLALGSSLHADLIGVNFDIGSGAGTYSGQGPAGAAGGSTWNPVTTNVGSGLLANDGSAAIGVGYGQGNQNAGFAFNDGVHGFGWAFPGGEANYSDTAYPGTTVYGSALMQDLLYDGSSTNVAGIRVSGLNPGVYKVYVMSWNPNATGTVYPVSIGLNLEQPSGSGYLTLGPGDSSLPFDANNWVAGINYVEQNVTVTSTSDYITAIIPSGGGVPTAVFNGLQIVPAPEPATASLLCAGGLLILRRRR